MERPHPCSSCEAPLEPDDGHELCPRCLGVAHLRDALGDDACMNCTYMPYAATHFCEFEEDGESSTSRTSMGSRSSSYSSLAVTEDSSMRDILRTALEQLNVAAPQQARSAPASAFFRHRPPPTSFTVPHSEDFLRELQASWIDSKAGTSLSADARALAAMHDAISVGLDKMPAIEPGIASLIMSPDESLRQDARCPRPQCRQTDDLLVRAYDSGARAGCIGNALSHLMLALSASLHGDDAGPGGKTAGEAGDSSNFCDAATCHGS
ncbi:LOW QUALITY PROTEIN: uncharacterized protein LOC114481864 [Xyrichtys novacula]|uniref:LOW QUALITY PROTEIN: uncharacterized protein LOC114481864 n=1 Tax=Xyrichtys novacula TaxID=13765 RepID=A0AAV1HG43_XYRNO|nr:LOW QUALITY PROTEIN: uncharacterized protein LOC114481864 [Xyrichtys novacula]